MTEILVSILLIAGSLFTLVAALGVVRMPDLYMRLSGASKASTLGAALILSGVAPAFGEVGATTKLAAIILFLFLTAPVAAHMIARAAYRTGTPLWKGTHVDELAPKRDGDTPAPGV